MCGIGGWIGAPPESNHYAACMTQALHHRGPDASGIRSWPDATLIHTRLSILDLSPTGAQPMANEDGTIWTSFNGEVYNHRELRRDLEARGHLFKGRSDTEILTHLYEEHGLDFVSKLRGMFALAIYDTRSRTLILARDRFGIKPLFYAPGAGRLAFASEIRALRELPGVDDRPDRQAIFDFAALFYIPAPATFYAGIRALQPGELLVARMDDRGVSWRTQTYHRWTIHPDPEMTLEAATDRADELLGAAVRRQMESDVPLGALLSGGIDSSLVCAAAQKISDGGLHTYNVRFHEREYDESWAARAVADSIGSQHRTLDITDVQGDWDHISALLQHAGQPYADTSLFAANAVCQFIRQHVTVALSGDGGDEGFGGYNDFSRIAWIARWLQLPTPTQRGTSRALASLARCGLQLPTPIQRGASRALASLARCGTIPVRLPQRLNELAGADDTFVFRNLFCCVGDQEQQRLCRDTDLLPVHRLFEPQWGHHLAPRASRREHLSAQATEIFTRLQLPNAFLFKVDTASMKEGLEIRVPMLDEDLFAFGLTLPHRLKVKGRMCKQVLRAIAQRRLPRTIATKPKQGFGIPVDTWVNEDFKRCMREFLLGPESGLPEFFHPEAYRPIIEAFCAGHPCPEISRQGLYQRAIMLLSLQLALTDRSSRGARPPDGYDRGMISGKIGLEPETAEGVWISATAKNAGSS